MSDASPGTIRRAVVIGAGTMGAAIAAHLANAGLTVHLLDITPAALTPEEAQAGLTLADRNVRNRIGNAGFQRMLAARPASLFAPSVADQIHLGNLEDDLATALADADWIIEAIVEQLAPKQELMARIEDLAPAHALVTTNTSGIPVRAIGSERSEGFRRRFLGAHFFNPPRYLPLVELIPTADTDPTVVSRLHAFLETALGKGVVLCKDTPNFIANRMVSFVLADLIDFAVRKGYTVEEVDALTGPLLGRPRSGTFRLNDVVGVDVWALIADNLHPLIPHDTDRDVLIAPAYRGVLATLIDAGHLGSKTGQGFYRTVTTDRGKEFWGLDLQVAAQRGEVVYIPPQSPTWPSVDAVRRRPLEQRLRSLVLDGAPGDPAATLVRHTILRTLAYAAQRIPEIATHLTDIDRALTWGYVWELGPFALWDALGVAETVTAMRAEGITVAAWVEQFLSEGGITFYSERDGVPHVYAPEAARPVPVARDPRVLEVATLTRRSPVVARNEAADLVDIGDGVLLLEFHAKANALGPAVFPIFEAALERLHDTATGLVIANDGVHFSAGADLRAMLSAAEAGEWNRIADLIAGGQACFMALRRSPKPVVAAPFQRVLGGGVEVCLAAHQVVAHAETYMGLVEVNVGLIPGWGGCKELVRRHVVAHDPLPGLLRVFDLISQARVSGSALEAQQLGYLTPHDHIIMHRGHLLDAARQTVLELAAAGFTPPATTRTVYAAGDAGMERLHARIAEQEASGRFSPHDTVISRELAAVLCANGGDGRMVDEQVILDLEHEAFLRLIAHPAGQARIRHMLGEGRPLRN